MRSRHAGTVGRSEHHSADPRPAPLDRGRRRESDEGVRALVPVSDPWSVDGSGRTNDGPVDDLSVRAERDGGSYSVRTLRLTGVRLGPRGSVHRVVTDPVATAALAIGSLLLSLISAGLPVDRTRAAMVAAVEAGSGAGRRPARVGREPPPPRRDRLRALHPDPARGRRRARRPRLGRRRAVEHRPAPPGSLPPARHPRRARPALSRPDRLATPRSGEPIRATQRTGQRTQRRVTRPRPWSRAPAARSAAASRAAPPRPPGVAPARPPSPRRGLWRAGAPW